MNDTAVVGAIRLALEAAANDETAVDLIAWLVSQAPNTQPGDTDSVRLLLNGIRARGLSFSVPSLPGALSSPTLVEKGEPPNEHE